jgi:plastocyanin
VQLKRTIELGILVIVLVSAAVLTIVRLVSRDTGSDAEAVAPHVKDSTPRAEDTAPAPPTSIVVNLDFDAAEGSSISVTKDGDEYARGETTIDEGKLAFRRAFEQSAPDGTYIVTYKACFPGEACADGHFRFRIDRSEARSFVDRRGEQTVQVDMTNVSFAPATIRVDRGTTVHWTNRDAVEHYVNTESHPYHTYFPTQNSRALSRDGEFTVTFDQPGWYPYHCSAHADVMRGAILVE